MLKLTERESIISPIPTSISADHLKVRWLSKENSLSMSETNSELQNMTITQYRKRQNSAKTVLRHRNKPKRVWILTNSCSTNQPEQPPPPWNLKFLLIRWGPFLTSIVDDTTIVKNYKRITLNFFFLLLFRYPKFKEKMWFLGRGVGAWGGGCSWRQTQKKIEFGLTHGVPVDYYWKRHF